MPAQRLIRDCPRFPADLRCPLDQSTARVSVASETNAVPHFRYGPGLSTPYPQISVMALTIQIAAQIDPGTVGVVRCV